LKEKPQSCGRQNGNADFRKNAMHKIPPVFR